MKKILTVSLFAMMAVSAANADIASTKYVTDRTGTTANLTTTAKELTGAVNELKTKLDTVAGTGEGSVSDQIDSALANYTDTAGMNSAIDAAKEAAITAAANDAKKYIDETELEASQNAQNQTLNTAIDAKQTKALVTSVEEESSDTTYPSAKAVYTFGNSIRAEVSEGNALAINNLTQTINANKTAADAGINEAKQAAAAADSKAQGAVDTNVTQQAAIEKNASDLAAYKTANDEAVAKKANSADVYSKTDADAEFMDSDEVEAAIAGAVTGTDGVLKNYSTTAQMNTAITNANSEQTTAITNAYTAADTALETKITNAYKAADTATLDAAKADATTKANTAKSEAIAAAKSAGDAAYAAKSYETIVDANEAFREAIANGTTTEGTDGTYALTATVSNGSVSGYKWELIGR